MSELTLEKLKIVERLQMLEDAQKYHTQLREQYNTENRDILNNILDSIRQIRDTLYGEGNGKPGHGIRMDRIEQLLKLLMWVLGTITFIFFGLMCQELWRRFLTQA